MPKNKKNAHLLQEMSIEDASAFWDEHSLFEFEGTEEIDVEFRLRRKQYIGIDPDLFKQIRSKARQKNTSPEALLESWIAEKIQATS